MKHATRYFPGRSKLSLAQLRAAEEMGRAIYAGIGLAPSEISLDRMAELCRGLGVEVYWLPGAMMEFSGALYAGCRRDGRFKMRIHLADHLSTRMAPAVCLHEYAHAVTMLMIRSGSALEAPAGGWPLGHALHEFEETVACACEVAFCEAGGKAPRSVAEIWRTCGWQERAREAARKQAPVKARNNRENQSLCRLRT